jgi:hypothetical protein
MVPSFYAMLPLIYYEAKVIKKANIMPTPEANTAA